MKSLRIRIATCVAQASGCASPRSALVDPGRPRSCFAAGYYYVVVRAPDRPAPARRARARAAARLRPAARAPARPVADRAPARRSAERPRLRASAPSAREAGRVRRRRRRGRDHAARPPIQGRSSCASCFSSRRRPAATARARPPRAGRSRERLELGGERRPSGSTLDAPVLTSLIGGEREKRRPVALDGDSAARGPGGAGHRGSPLLRPSRRRSDRHGRRARRERHRRQRAYLVRRQHDHAAAGAQRLPAEVRRQDAADARASGSIRREAARAVSSRSCSTPARRRTRSSRCT